MGNLTTGTEVIYNVKKSGNGVYAFLLEGDATVATETLNRRDAVGITDATSFTVKADSNAKILLMEVPMN